ncbi:MAG: hypothetical protein JWO50_786 [Candidatus Kaiserbacteria bacterium]|nr:hypothetical protein [Candidatus Kaiserbacteria bacterium]
MEALFKNKIILAGIVIAIVTVAWFTLGSSSQSGGVLQSAGTAGDSGTTGSDLIQTLTNLETVSLDAPIFTDPAFLSLKDFSRQIVAEPTGRHDPFAPLGNDTTGAGTVQAPPQASSTSSTTLRSGTNSSTAQ